MAAARVGCGPACALGVGLLLLLVAAGSRSTPTAFAAHCTVGGASRPLTAVQPVKEARVVLQRELGARISPTSRSRPVLFSGWALPAVVPPVLSPIVAAVAVLLSVIGWLTLRSPSVTHKAEETPRCGTEWATAAAADSAWIPETFGEEWFLVPAQGQGDVLSFLDLQAGCVFVLGSDLDAGATYSKPSWVLSGRVADRHARLDFADGAYWLEDLESPQGTFVNGARLAPFQSHRLALGDRIVLGVDNADAEFEVVRKPTAKKP
eukprot:TRINITY_DN3974_c0_g1_i1.p1 TRINITY_DN3974_c0_g1~~TRINITY_DN3974_c0_g1_i1.p1  ORF type:complete len:278 (+),score=26.31 TRINITY_DN3974_c0_g1_i1:44-835(+)